MRVVTVACVLALAACGRISFDRVDDGGTSDGSGDAPDASQGDLYSRVAYLKPSNTTAGANFGAAVAVSADGKTIAVGAPLESTTGLEAGAVYIFRFTGVTWVEEAIKRATNTEAGDQFGWSVGLSGDGNTLVVGARREDSGNALMPSDNSVTSSGAAYVFTRSGSVWTQAAYIKAPTIGASDSFGERVTISDNASRIAIAAPDEDSATNTINGNEGDDSAPEAGAVWVFAGPAWGPEAYLKAPNADAGDAFGYKLALGATGNFLVVGAYREDNSTTGVGAALTNDDAANSGIAYMFSGFGGVWSNYEVVKASNTDAGDNFGYAVGTAPDASTVVIAAPSESSLVAPTDNLSPFSGAAYTYEGEPFVHTGLVKAPSQDMSDELGYCVGVSAQNVFVIGAPYEDGGTAWPTVNTEDDSMAEAGAAYTFIRDNGAWIPHRNFKATSPTAEDQFGSTCDISDNARTVVIGAPLENGGGTGIDPPHDEAATDSGAVYVYY